MCGFETLTCIRSNSARNATGQLSPMPSSPYAPLRLTNIPPLEPQKSHSVVVVQEIDIARTPSIAPHKLLITWRPFVLHIPCEHTLYTHADTLDVLDGTPALSAQQIQTNDAVGVDVWMDWDWAVGCAKEGHLWGFFGEWAMWSAGGGGGRRKGRISAGWGNQKHAPIG